MIAAENQPHKRKWNLWRAALYGFIFGVVAFIINALADSGKDLSLWLQARPGEIIVYFGGRLLAAPLLFVLVAVIRNLVFKNPN
jgi:H+/Cl- antiporter ClcA